MDAELQLEAEGALLEAEPRASILVIDDDIDQALVLARRLEGVGFAVATEHEGRGGIERAAAERPNLILLDLGLPDMHGLEVCRELADSPPTCGVPVIVLSAQDGPHIVRDCRAAGSEFFVRKPYDPNVLLAVIEQSLSGW